MTRATKAISLVLVGSGAVLLGYTAFRPRTPNYYAPGGYSSTQPSSYHGGGGYRGGTYVPVPYRSGRYSGYSGPSGGSGSHYSGSSGSSQHYSGAGHSSGTSRGGFGSSGRSSAA